MHLTALLYLLLCTSCYSSRMSAKNDCRLSRSCYKENDEEESTMSNLAFYRMTLFENPVYLILLIILGTFIFLFLLGFIKGVLGLFVSKKIGSAGLHLLIDLPRNLHEYQEYELKHRCIIYDVAGWPVHPDTRERSVRAMTKNMEFCLNLVFFFLYPMSKIVHLCSLCCCIETVHEHDEEAKYLNEGNITMDMYEDELREEEDTNYVINILKTSKSSLCRHN
ncbi:uncharacterized protein LOC109609134 [Aethina tumida]|uniref:uncharacterized protein LOC109609134 n=1 Tax=Aethina tumida TaxID=116153 RepID=UPI00096B0EDD|nr:uncharacterized protein LOC109609134 [Aethina tumida]